MRAGGASADGAVPVSRRHGGFGSAAGERERDAACVVLTAMRAAESYAMSRVMSQRAGDLSRLSDAVHGINKATREGTSYWQTRVSAFVEAGIKLTREERMWHRRLSDAAEKYFLALEDWQEKERRGTRGDGRESGEKKKIDYDHDYDYDHDKEKDEDRIKDRDGKARPKKESKNSVAWLSGGKKKAKKEFSRSEFLVGLNAGESSEARAGNVIDVHAAAVEAVSVRRE